MRGQMLAAHPNPTSLFDLKHDRGGMVDIEFIVQYLVLAHAHTHAALTRNAGNIGLLALAAELGLVPGMLATRVADAYRDLSPRAASGAPAAAPRMRASIRCRRQRGAMPSTRCGPTSSGRPGGAGGGRAEREIG